MEALETERLLLRPWRTDDEAEAESLFRYASDPKIGPSCGWPPHASICGSMETIRDILAVPDNWAITLKAGGTWDIGGDDPVGSIALRPVGRYVTDLLASNAALERCYGMYADDSAVEVGYWIGHPFWGKGYMSEALSAVLAYAFGTLEKSAVWGGRYRENARSGRVMERCGLHIVGESEHDYFPLIDEYHDHVHHIITADEQQR